MYIYILYIYIYLHAHVHVLYICICIYKYVYIDIYIHPSLYMQICRYVKDSTENAAPLKSTKLINSNYTVPGQFILI